MAIILNDHAWPAKTVKAGIENAVDIPSGMFLKIETGPSGQELLTWISPPGESWTARIIVELTKLGT